MDQLPDIFKALGDTIRLKIMQMLAEQGEICVCKVQEALGMGQSAVSHHMAVLRRARLLISRREGQKIFYRINAEVFTGSLMPWTSGILDLLALEPAGSPDCD